MSAKSHDLHTRQTQLFAELYPVFAENQHALDLVTERAYRAGTEADMISAENSARWLFNKYRRKAERDGALDRHGRPVFRNLAHIPSTLNLDRRAA